MKLLHSFSIKGKLIFIILTVTILTIVIGFSIVITTSIRTFKDEMLNATKLNTKLVARYCVAPLLFQDKKGVEDNLKEMSQLPHIELSQLYDENGNLFGSFNKINKIVKPENPKAEPYQRYQDEYLEILEEVIYENNRFGSIYVRASTTLLQSKIDRFLLIMIILSLGLIVFAILLANYLQQIISQPILELAQTTEKIALEEDYSLRVTKKSNDEIGTLYDGFNNMLELIMQRQITIDRALIEIQESEDKFKQMTQSAFNAIIVIDENGLIKYWNKAAAKIFGYNEKEILGQSLNKLLVTTTDFEKFKKESTDTIAANCEISGESFEIPAIRKNNTKFPIEVAIAPIWIKRKWHSVAIIKDISDWKRTEQELINAKEKAIESDKLKSAFLSNMSHEIRTPMNSIIGFAELLSDPNLFEKKREKYLNYITSSGKALLNLINDIIDVSKIEAGQLKIKKTNNNVNQIMSELHATLNNANKNNDKISFRLSQNNQDKEIEIYTDPFRLRQIITNLVSNAFKFTDSGYVELGYNLKNESIIEFFVKDTGIGIPEDKLTVIFDRFGQVEDTYDKNQSGTGLGLAISKKLAEMLGGELRVESVINKGSIFYLTLPVKISNQPTKHLVPEETTQETTASGIHDWSDKLILIAEDEDINYMFLVEALNFTQVKIIWTKDGRETIKVCKENSNIDLVLMDVKMPELDGYETTKQIKAFRPELPIIAQTAYAMAGEREKAFQAECDDFITKPIRPKKLLTTLTKYLG